MHIIVLAKGGHIVDPGFTRLSVVMPHWFLTLIWRKQFPQDGVCRGDVSIKLVQFKYPADGKLIYCPNWAAPRKSHRPRKDKKRNHGVMNAVTKRKRTFL